MTRPIVLFDEVSKEYRAGKVSTVVLQQVQLEVQPGELLAIVGTSGSGKSTLLNIVGGLDRDYRGVVKVEDNDLSQLSDDQLSRLRNEKVGFVFQQFNLLEHLTCLENVALPAMFSSTPLPDVAQRAIHALERVGMADRAQDRPTNLSGGQKQRVAIARALFRTPPLLLCDEPTGNLDTLTGQQIIELFSELNEKDRITLIIVTHESRVSAAAHRVLRLEDGQLKVDDGVVGVEAPRTLEH